MSSRASRELSPTTKSGVLGLQQDDLGSALKDSSQSFPDKLPTRQVRLASNASLDVLRPVRRNTWKPREYQKWKSPLLMSIFYLAGLGFTGAHCGLYAKLNGTIVGGSRQQETNLRYAANNITCYIQCG